MHTHVWYILPSKRHHICTHACWIELASLPQVKVCCSAWVAYPRQAIRLALLAFWLLYKMQISGSGAVKYAWSIDLHTKGMSCQWASTHALAYLNLSKDEDILCFSDDKDLVNLSSSVSHKSTQNQSRKHCFESSKIRVARHATPSSIVNAIPLP